MSGLQEQAAVSGLGSHVPEQPQAAVLTILSACIADSASGEEKRALQAQVAALGLGSNASGNSQAAALTILDARIADSAPAEEKRALQARVATLGSGSKAPRNLQAAALTTLYARIAPDGSKEKEDWRKKEVEGHQKRSTKRMAESFPEAVVEAQQAEAMRMAAKESTATVIGENKSKQASLLCTNCGELGRRLRRSLECRNFVAMQPPTCAHCGFTGHQTHFCRSK